jgi:hypothetical protein
MKKLNEKGYAIIFVTLAFVIIGLFVGFATDGGRGFLLRSELERTVDAAAVAGAARFATGGLSAAQAAACDAAGMNGVTSCSNFVVTQVTVNDASGNPKTGIQVTGTASTPTIFMRLGKLLGCGASCDSISATAAAVAASGGFVDLVMNLDDTASMSSGGWIGPAKTGANALVNAMVSTGGSSAAMVSLVPFRGGYNTTNPPGATGYENKNEYPAGTVVSLTTDNTKLHSGINALAGVGGSGTNNCEGLMQSRIKLFQSGVARTNAQKFLVVLTDASSNGSHPATFIPNCGPNTTTNPTNAQINFDAYTVAQDIKNGTNIGTTGQVAGQTVKVFVIFYGSSGPAPVNCTPPPGGANATNGWNTTALNLGRCIASTAGDMYFAPTPSSVTAAFQQIINRLPVLILN